MIVDDLPWPELGNVSRGATRGNQGQKGVIGTPDNEGRAILQLRVQPGVLPILLNRQATDWYRTLDNEVNRALKLTKTYWRKARRRQDYDARADQDHMELHEWLQQLKDKVMSHLELLMQKGEIQGPPYIMPDNLELTFLRKFIDRQASGIPHNPRMRQGYTGSRSPRTAPSLHLEGKSSSSSEGTSTPSANGWDATEDQEHSSGQGTSPTVASFSDGPQSVLSDVEANRRVLKSARSALTRAQKDTQEAFARYKTCLDLEGLAQQQLSAAEERRDALMSSLMEAYRMEASEASETSSRKSVAVDDSADSAAMHFQPRTSPRQGHEQTSRDIFQAGESNWRGMREATWPTGDVVMSASTAPGIPQLGSQAYQNSPLQNGMQATSQDPSGRKHPRSWEAMEGQGEHEQYGMPPHKRYQFGGTEPTRNPLRTMPVHRTSFNSPTMHNSVPRLETHDTLLNRA